jgi:cell wall-associated NlpC family hydrolase
VNDPRLTPANARVAAAHLDHCAPGLIRVTGEARQVAAALTDLRRAPDGPRDRQLLFGAAVTVYEDRDGYSFVQAAKDGYVGYVATAALGQAKAATHWISAPSSHLYPAPDIKSPERMALSFGALLHVRAMTARFAETPQGFVPRIHLREIGTPLPDPVETARLFIGTPYLWGGNSRFGIDCSGLIQAAMQATWRNCPGDSDQQERAFGAALPPGTKGRRGDLLFWPGHVGMLADANTLLHANAHHMAVVQEPLTGAIARIQAQGEGPPRTHLRP